MEYSSYIFKDYSIFIQNTSLIKYYLAAELGSKYSNKLINRSLFDDWNNKFNRSTYKIATKSNLFPNSFSKLNTLKQIIIFDQNIEV